jgi:hypothetical protein
LPDLHYLSALGCGSSFAGKSMQHVIPAGRAADDGLQTALPTFETERIQEEKPQTKKEEARFAPAAPTSLAIYAAAQLLLLAHCLAFVMPI